MSWVARRLILIREGYIVSARVQLAGPSKGVIWARPDCEGWVGPTKQLMYEL